jgi:3-hydroxy-3-methylglutaryl CoA synthase
MVGIAAWGAYAPRLRLSRKAVTEANAWVAPNLRAKAKGERAMANWDEDALTMAVEAARDALGPDDDRTAIDALYFASTTAPFVDRQNAGIVAAALTLEKAIASADVTGSQRCGLAALGQALAMVQGGAAKRALVATGEHRRARAASSQELDNGDGAAAFVVTADAGAAEFLGRGSITDDFVDHFRGADSAFDYGWEERWIRDEGIVKLVPAAIRQALQVSGLNPSDVAHFCFPSTFAGMAATLAKTVGIAPEAVRDNLALTLGEAGCAHGPLMLAHALEQAKPGEVILVAQFGQGAEALVFRAGEQVEQAQPARGVTGALADRKDETNYLKFLTFSMSPPNHYGMIVFEGGGRIMMDITDVEPGEVDSGLPVKMVFRIKDVDEKRGFVRYFWKAAPDRAAMAKNTALAAE